MARPIVLGNGKMAIGLDSFGLVHDFYFPYVGLENHSSERSGKHKLGIFVDGSISWLDNGSWKIDQSYLYGRMIGLTTAVNDELSISLEFQDFIDYELNVFARNIHVINISDKQRQIKLFMHQAFTIGEAADGHDTAQYLPASSPNSSEKILHYKGERCFVIEGHHNDGNSFDSFSIGNFGQFEDGYHDGVWRDAEDGQLSRNPVERIRTDSVIEFDLSISAHDSARVNYQLTAANSIERAIRISEKFQNDGIQLRLLGVDHHWRDWIEPAARVAEIRVSPEYRSNFLSSLIILKAMMDRRGAIMASIDTEMLRYTRDAYVDCWPRDASYVYLALLRLGYIDEVQQFLRFANDILTDEGYFWQMYRPDASVGPNSHAYIHNGEIAPPIQTDETAITLYLFTETLKSAVRHGDKLASWRELYDSLARPMANFLADFIDPVTKLPKPSYEIWEVIYQTTTYTTALTYGSLKAAAEIAEMFGETSDVIKWRLTAEEIQQSAGVLWNNERNFPYRGILHRKDGTDYDATIDLSALYASNKFGLFDKEHCQFAFDSAIQTFGLGGNNVGAPRFEYDDYNQAIKDSFGNPWFITSFWLAQQDISESNSDNKLAKSVLDWANDYMNKNNILPEQVNPIDGSMVSAAPLAWSHAEFIQTCLDFGKNSDKDNK